MSAARVSYVRACGRSPCASHESIADSVDVCAGLLLHQAGYFIWKATKTGQPQQVPYLDDETVYQAFARYCERLTGKTFLSFVQDPRVLVEKVGDQETETEVQPAIKASTYDYATAGGRVLLPRAPKGKSSSGLLEEWRRQTDALRTGGVDANGHPINPLQPPFSALGEYDPDAAATYKAAKKARSPSSQGSVHSSSPSVVAESPLASSTPASGQFQPFQSPTGAEAGTPVRFPDLSNITRSPEMLPASGARSAPPVAASGSGSSGLGTAAAAMQLAADRSQQAVSEAQSGQGGYFSNFMQGSGNSAATAFGDGASAAGNHGVAGVQADHSSLAFATSTGSAQSGSVVAAACSGDLPRPSRMPQRNDAYMANMPDDLIVKMETDDGLRREAVVQPFDTGMRAASFRDTLTRCMKSVVKLQGLCAMDVFNVAQCPDPAVVTLAAVQDHIRRKGRTSATASIICINPPLLLTNFHVFASPAFADPSLRIQVQLDFDDEDDALLAPPVHGTLDPQTFFWSSASLDACVVAWRPPTDARHMEGRFPVMLPGESRVAGNINTDPLDHRLMIIGHPNGLVKHVSAHGCKLKLVYRKDGAVWVVYSNDTHGGSSGSPVFNMHGDIVALHHCAFEHVRNPNGTYKLDATGAPIRANNAGTDAAEIFGALLKEATVRHAANPADPSITVLKALLTQDHAVTSIASIRSRMDAIGW